MIRTFFPQFRARVRLAPALLVENDNDLPRSAVLNPFDAAGYQARRQPRLRLRSNNRTIVLLLKIDFKTKAFHISYQDNYTA